LIIGFTDHITDRPDSPYGFSKYRAFWEGVFLPVSSKIGQLINVHIMPIRELDFENIDYVGLTSSFYFSYPAFLLFQIHFY